MINVSLAIFLLVFAVAVNSVSVYAQKKYGFYNRFGSNNFLIHSLVITPLWILFLYASVHLSSNPLNPNDKLKLLGVLGIIISLVIFTVSIRQLGSQALSNGIFFGKSKVTHAGIYQYLNDPIYDSYVLATMSIGLFTQNANYFPIAAALWVLLKIESLIEQPTN